MTERHQFALNLADDVWPMLDGNVALLSLASVPQAYETLRDPVTGRLTLRFIEPFANLVLIEGETVALDKAMQLVEAVACFRRAAGLPAGSFDTE